MLKLTGCPHSQRELMAFSLFIFAAAAASYFFIDLPLAAVSRGLDQRIKDFFEVVTVLGESTWSLAAAAFAGLTAHFFWRREDWTRWSLFVFSAVAASGIITDLIKWLAGRWRPKAHFTDQFYGFDFFGVGYEQTSFPSGHATTIWALCLALAVIYPRLRFLWYALAIIVSMSRVIIGAHYLSDIVAGIFVAVMTVIFLTIFPFFCLK